MSEDDKPVLADLPTEVYADLRGEIVQVLAASTMQQAVLDLFTAVLHGVDWSKVDNDMLSALRSRIDDQLMANIK